MTVDGFTMLGFAAGAVTSLGFIPQIIRGYARKRLDDISYWMPLVLAFGMSLWLAYGIIRSDLAIIIANSFGVGCNFFLMGMKKWYSKNTSSIR